MTLRQLRTALFHTPLGRTVVGFAAIAAVMTLGAVITMVWTWVTMSDTPRPRPAGRISPVDARR
jgi:hypothetical protein